MFTNNVEIINFYDERLNLSTFKHTKFFNLRTKKDVEKKLEDPSHYRQIYNEGL